MTKWRIGLSVAAVCVASLAVFGLASEAAMAARDAARFPAPGVMVKIEAGQALHIRCIGPKGGPTVVMIAGGGTPSVVSYVLQAKTAQFARVCSYDRPGLGWSPPASRALTFDDHVRQLNALLKKGGVPAPYVLVPESFGSLIAIGFARQYPQKVAGVVFVDGVDPKLWFTEMREQAGLRSDFQNLAAELAWRFGLVRLAFDAFAPNWLQRAPAPIHAQTKAIYSRPAAGFDEALVAYRASPVDQRPILSPGMLGDRPVIAVQHGKPSSALATSLESGWPAAQRRLASMSRAGQIIVAANAGHQLAQEAPDLAASAIKTALEGDHHAEH